MNLDLWSSNRFTYKQLTAGILRVIPTSTHLYQVIYASTSPVDEQCIHILLPNLLDQPNFTTQEEKCTDLLIPGKRRWLCRHKSFFDGMQKAPLPPKPPHSASALKKCSFVFLRSGICLFIGGCMHADVICFSLSTVGSWIGFKLVMFQLGMYHCIIEIEMESEEIVSENIVSTWVPLSRVCHYH